MVTTLDQRMDRWETRQEALIASVSGLAEVIQTSQEMLTALMGWLQQPPSSDMADLIRALTSAVSVVQDLTARHGEDIRHLQSLVVRLPAEVARAVQAGQAG